MGCKSYVVLCAAFCMGTLIAHPKSVVVVGGGPTGLGAVIEARESGADVILIEKRSAYTRQNTLFLYTVTLELLERWNAQIPAMEELEFRGERRGFVLIKDLEDGLTHRADALGVQRIVGEFVDFAEDSHAVILQVEDERVFLPYDVLVAADGIHSKVREKLGISCHSLGQALGSISMISAMNPQKEIIAETQPHEEVFAKKVLVPSATIVFMQNHPETPLKNLSLSEMTRIISEIGWREEATQMAEGAVFEMENVAIYLQHSSTFSNRERDVILLGDAAGTGSFYQGTGANFSLKTTQLAKELFRDWPQEDAYEKFNHAMEKEVDWLIEISRPLF